MDKIRYLTTESVTELHTFILNTSGGRHGFKDKNSLSSTLCFVQYDEYYKTFIDKISYLIFSIASNHCFVDGNKRTAISSASLFLMINNYEYCIDRFIVDMEYLVVALVEHKIDRDTLSLFIECILNDDDYPENLKLIMFNIMDNQINRHIDNRG